MKQRGKRLTTCINPVKLLFEVVAPQRLHEIWALELKIWKLFIYSYKHLPN